MGDVTTLADLKKIHFSSFSPNSITSSNNDTASGLGCSKLTTVIRFINRDRKLKMRNISTVLAVSNPVEISSPQSNGVSNVIISPTFFDHTRDPCY